MSVFSVAVCVGLSEKTVEGWSPNYVSSYRLAKKKKEMWEIVWLETEQLCLMTLKDQRILFLPLLFPRAKLFSHIQLQKILENSNRELASTKPRIQSCLALVTMILLYKAFTGAIKGFWSSTDWGPCSHSPQVCTVRETATCRSSGPGGLLDARSLVPARGSCMLKLLPQKAEGLGPAWSWVSKEW